MTAARFSWKQTGHAIGAGHAGKSGANISIRRSCTVARHERRWRTRLAPPRRGRGRGRVGRAA
eukprot:3662474-Pyramimonas_sp.AAC.1